MRCCWRNISNRLTRMHSDLQHMHECAQQRFRVVPWLAALRDVPSLMTRRRAFHFFCNARTVWPPK